MSLNDNSTKSVQISTGSSAVVFTSPNLITYTLPSTGYIAGKDEVALKSLTIYYSWPNISAALGNNTFSYIWPATGLTYSVVIADGIYQFSDLNNYLQQVMFANGHYLLDANSNPVYYITLILNTVIYCITMQITPLPATLPASWTNPTSVNLATAANRTPQLLIGSLATLTGFPAATYPAVMQTSVYYVNSGIPQATGSTSINVRCNLVNNRDFSTNNDILSTFALSSGSESGSLITYAPFALDWMPAMQNTFQTITLTLTDQLNRPILIRDPSGIVAVVNIRRRN